MRSRGGQVEVMGGVRYSDREAKLKLLNLWPFKPTLSSWNGGSGPWVRVRPDNGDGGTMPALVRVSATGGPVARTLPDGMYVHLLPGAVSADVLAIEVCGASHNLSDKRSRYSATTGSLLLLMPSPWMNTPQAVKGPVPRSGPKERWCHFDGAFNSALDRDLLVPVARLRAFYFVPDNDLARWASRTPLESHEYLLPQSALDTPYDPQMKEMIGHAFHSRVWS